MTVYEIDGVRFESDGPLSESELEELAQSVPQQASQGRAMSGAGQMGRRQFPQQSPDRFTVGEAAGTLGQGAVAGLAEVIGAPVDVLTAGANLIPGVDIERPVGGSEQLKQAAGRFSLPDDVRPALRPFAQAGRVIGGSAPIAAIPFGMAAQPARAGAMLPTPSTQGMLSTAAETARQAPRQFAMTEAASAGGAAAGAAGAEALFPGSMPAAIVGEVAGGIASPTAIMARTMGRLSDDFRRGFDTLTPEGIERATGRELQGLLERAGEPPLQVSARAARENPFGLTSAALTESPTLTALERSLISKDPAASNALLEQYRVSKAALNDEIIEAIRSGSPEALRGAAQARQRYFEDLVDARIALAETRAQGAADAIRPATADSPSAAGPAVRAEIEAARADARAMETELWEQIPQDVEVPTDSTIESYRRAREGLLVEDGESLPAPIEGFVNRAIRTAEGQSNQGGITAGELLTLRSRALRLARDARSGMNPNPDLARRLDILADGIVGDLESVPGQAVDAARSFSRVLNERFGPVRQITGTSAGGGEMTSPELALQRSIGQGGPRGAVAARQQRESVEPIRTEFTEMPETLRPQNVTAEQEQYIRGLLENTINVSSGRVNPDRLATFRRQNRDLLAQFPELDQATATAEAAERFAGRSVRALNDLRKSAETSAFARVAAVENPAEVFRSAIRGSNPNRDVARLFTLGRRGGPEAAAGARASFLESALEQSKDSSGFIRGDEFKQILERHATAAVNNGVMTQQQVRQLERVADVAEQVRRTMTSGQRLEEQISNPSAMFDLLASIAGANVGGMSALGQAAGAPIVLAGRGASAARNMLIRAPQLKVENFLIEALKDPQKLSWMLAQPTTARQRRMRDRQVNAFLVQIGLTEGAQDDAETP
ncbi:MAG TPA: hypothetical protein VIG24_12495 [Acidimicrobiia bacterium]